MKYMNRILSFVLVLVMLVSCFGTAFAAETHELEETKPATRAADIDKDELIVADWLWGSVMEERGPETIMKEYAETGFTDIYLLIKGTGGTTSWNTSVGYQNSYSYDLLQTALDAARPYGIRIHAWMMAARDDLYMTNNPGDNYYHFRVGTSDSVNQYVNLRNADYQTYFTNLVKELCAKYPDLAGIHLDTIRYGGLYYDWGAETRELLISKYGITKAEYNAATIAMCAGQGYTYGYNSDGYVVYSSSGTTASGTTFASALTGSGSTDLQNGAKKFKQLRIDTVNDFVKLVSDAAPGKIISAAIMPEPATNNVYEICVYGQDYASMSKCLDYICVMSYASTYGAQATWPTTLSKNIANAGGNVVTAIQYFPNEDGSGTGPSNSRIYEEIYNVMKYRKEVNSDSNTSTGNVLGYASFRYGFGVYGGVEVVDENTLRITAMNQVHSSPVTKLVLNMKNGVTISNVTNKSGWGSASFSFSNSNQTLTISGSFLNTKGVSSFEVDYTGTVDEVLGACLMSASTSSGELYTICNTIMQKGCKHNETITASVPATCTTAGSATYTCSLCGETRTETIPALGHKYETVYDEATLTTTFTCTGCGHTYSVSCEDSHARVETWSLTETTHEAFCYSCLSYWTETCNFKEVKRVAATCTADGYVEYVCDGIQAGAHDAYSGAGCGNTKKEVLPAGCTYGEWKDSGNGMHTATCTVCGKTKTEAHNVVKQAAVAPTCTETGLTEGSYCSDCKAVIVAQTVVPATGHTEVIVPAVAATCTTDGSTEGKYCSVCMETLVATQVIPAKGHTEVTTPGYAPTCIATGMTDKIACSVCGEVIQAATVIPAAGHSYTYEYEDEDGHIRGCSKCAYSEYMEHAFSNGECACGAKENLEPTLDGNIAIRHTLNLQSDISIGFVVPANLLSGYDMSTVYMDFTMDVYTGNVITGTKNVRVAPVLNGSYYYFNMEGITALQMNDTVRATMYGMKNGVFYCSANDSFSVATYAYAMLNNASIDGKVKTVCANLLRYGASAQTYKGYRTNALVDAAMTNAHKAYLTDLNTVTFGNTNKQLGDITNPTVTWLGKTLVLDSKVTVKYVVNVSKFSGDASKLSLRVRYTDINGGAKEIVLNNAEMYNNNANYYAFAFDKLTAAELRTVMSVAVLNGNTQVSETMEFSVDTYGNNISGSLLTLCKAMLAYSDAAKAQFS